MRLFLTPPVRKSYLKNTQLYGTYTTATGTRLGIRELTLLHTTAIKDITSEHLHYYMLKGTNHICLKDLVPLIALLIHFEAVTMQQKFRLFFQGWRLNKLP